MKRIKLSIGAVIPVILLVIFVSSIADKAHLAGNTILASALAFVIAFVMFKRDKNYHSGTVVGYKKLVYRNGYYHSPRRGNKWTNNRLTFSGMVESYGEQGIYVLRSKNDPQLRDYDGDLCKIRCNGYIEYEHGYLTEDAEIVEVL